MRDRTKHRASGPPYLRRGPILIVEDDRDLAEVLAETLETEGYEVAVAGNGREALRLLDEGVVRPSLILLDLMMPIMNGWELKEQLVQTGRGAIPIVVCTADGHAATKAKDMQAAGHLRKPATVDALLDEVVRLVGFGSGGGAYPG